MKATFLESPALLRNLGRLTKECTGLDIAMAFVKVSGLNKLMKHIESLIERGGRVRIVFGLSPSLGITDKEAAMRLLVLTKNRNVKVKKIDRAGFHPKLYIFHGEAPALIIGSSNITDSGMRKNAEANIMIEEADEQLYLDSNRFFNTYFKAGVDLTSKHIMEYNSHKKESSNKKVSYYEYDYLPSPEIDKLTLPINPVNIWNISPSSQGVDWPEWFEEIDENNDGFVAIGWDIGDMSDYSYKKIIKKVEAYAARRLKETGKKTKKRYVIGQLFTFRNFSSDDLLIIYSRQRIYGIAKVTPESRYQYRGNPNISYENQMNVKYLYYNEKPERADSYLIKNLGKQGTIKPIDREVWNYIRETYS